MKLYLSSFRMGDAFDQLVSALPPSGRVVVVSNAVDYIAEEDRLAYARAVFDPVEHFRSFGFTANDLDLRRFFADPSKLAPALEDAHLVWAIGGNPFLLRRAMRQSGFDNMLRDRIGSSGLIYGGWSAGAVVAGSSLRGLELMDDPEVVVEGYDEAPIWDGLGLVDFTIVPHFQSPHPEAAAAGRTVTWLKKQGEPFRTLRDGEAIIL